MTRLTITLGVDEGEALVKLALSELRTPRDQARFMIRKAMERKGILNEIDPESTTAMIQGRTENRDNVNSPSR